MKSKDTYTSVAGPSVQCPAVRTTVGEIRVPEQRNRPSVVVNRTSPTFVCTVSGVPPVIAPAGETGINAATTDPTAMTSAADFLMSTGAYPIGID